MWTTWLIGCGCKHGDVFSSAVLIARGLDLRFIRFICAHRFFPSLFGFQGTLPLSSICAFSSVGRAADS